jgi:hypothetical protein
MLPAAVPHLPPPHFRTFVLPYFRTPLAHPTGSQYVTFTAM